MKNTPSLAPSSSTVATFPAPGDFEELLAQLQEAYPSATDKLLAQAISESRKELGDSEDREQLLRCIRERITA